MRAYWRVDRCGWCWVLETTREQMSTPAPVKGGQPLADSAARLLSDLELHRPAGLFLDHCGSIANSPADEHVIYRQQYEVTAPELAVDRQIEHREIALSALQLEADSNRPNILRLQGTLLADQASFVPRVVLPTSSRLFGAHDCLHRSPTLAVPAPGRHRPVGTAYSERARSHRLRTFAPSRRNGEVRPFPDIRLGVMTMSIAILILFSAIRTTRA